MPAGLHRTRFIRALGGAAIAAALVGAGTALAADHAVAISGFSFSPGSVTVTVGDTVTWTNSDAQGHTATADDASWNSGPIQGSGGSRTVTFDAAGSFPYHCTIHPDMTGTVTVQAAAAGGGPTTPPTDTAATGADAGPAGATLATVTVIGLAWLGGLAVARRRVSERS